jgi:hypothetical protein
MGTISTSEEKAIGTNISIEKIGTEPTIKKIISSPTIELVYVCTSHQKIITFAAQENIALR